jgi:hypothetical protein
LRGISPTRLISGHLGKWKACDAPGKGGRGTWRFDLGGSPTDVGPIAQTASSNFLMMLFQFPLLIIDIITLMRDIRADSKKQGEAKRRELVAELNRMDQGVIAKAVEGSIGCVLENGVLHLQYSQPSRHSGHAKVLGDPTLRAILDRAAKQVGAEILVF